MIEGRFAPRIYLSNWGSWRTPGHHGPGPLLSIMAGPREWEHGEGYVLALTPFAEWRRRADAGAISLRAYQDLFLERWDSDPYALFPGSLLAYEHQGGDGPSSPVRPGSTLCCACSRADAAAGRCHRVWAAQRLYLVGWTAVLDGAVLGEPPAQPSLF